MTPTVTEAMVEARDWIAKQVAQLSELPHRYAEEIAGLKKVSAALEAALAASAGVGATVPALNVDALAQEIRRVDGNNTLGAGALAEALMPFLRNLSSQPK